MVARDDSVQRGSSIAARIFLVLLVFSIVLNYFLYRWGDTQRHHVESAQTRLLATQTELGTQVDQAQLMKTMLGLGALTKAKFDVLKQGASGDPDMDAISLSFVRDMALFGPDVELQNRNYPTLASYLNTAIRDRQNAYDAMREAALEARSKATSEAQNAPPPQPSDLPK